MDAFVFQALLASEPAGVQSEPVVRTIALREDQTLEHLHEALRIAFGWDDPHLHAFWMSGKWWDPEGVSYQSEYGLEDAEEDILSSRIPLSEIGLRKGKAIAYLFDFGDEWRLLLKVVDRWDAGFDSYPMLIEASGVAPPQYPPFEDEPDD